MGSCLSRNLDGEEAVSQITSYCARLPKTSLCRSIFYATGLLVYSPQCFPTRLFNPLNRHISMLSKQLDISKHHFSAEITKETGGETNEAKEPPAEGVKD